MVERAHQGDSPVQPGLSQQANEHNFTWLWVIPQAQRDPPQFGAGFAAALALHSSLLRRSFALFSRHVGNDMLYVVTSML
mmetsp:Transcript_42604/g.86945  ORF Transcript_42604/g.86945 Transcript_42604/m.86945 type:complete len:80 (-) Transcript_42604:49-288(-)